MVTKLPIRGLYSETKILRIFDFGNERNRRAKKWQ